MDYLVSLLWMENISNTSLASKGPKRAIRARLWMVGRSHYSGWRRNYESEACAVPWAVVTSDLVRFTSSQYYSPQLFVDPADVFPTVCHVILRTLPFCLSPGIHFDSSCPRYLELKTKHGVSTYLKTMLGTSPRSCLTFKLFKLVTYKPCIDYIVCGTVCKGWSLAWVEKRYSLLTGAQLHLFFYDI